MVRQDGVWYEGKGLGRDGKGPNYVSVAKKIYKIKKKSKNVLNR